MGRRAVVLALLGALGAGAGCATLFGPKKPRVEFTPYPESQVAAVRNPHDYLGKPLCQRCHLTGDRGLTSGAISLCVSCHAFGHGNHPVDVVQPTPARRLRVCAGAHRGAGTQAISDRNPRAGYSLPRHLSCIKDDG